MYAFLTQQQIGAFMKVLTVLLALSVSSTIMASEEYGALWNISASSGDSTFATSDSNVFAKVLLNDTQEAMQSGKISVLLAQKIREIQAQDSEVSVLEAIEILAAEAASKVK